MYLVGELDSTLTVLHIQQGVFRERQKLSTLSVDAAPGNLSCAIVLDPHRRRIYVSNRGHDSIATFAIGDDGSVALFHHAASGGSSPRFVGPHKFHKLPDTIGFDDAALLDIYAEQVEVLELVARGKLQTQKLITRRFPLDWINQALDVAQDKERTNAIFVGLTI